MIAGNLCSVISDHQFLVEPSSFMHNSSKEKITKRCFKKLDKKKFKSNLGKVNWKKHCNNPDPNVSMEHFLKIVHALLDRLAPFKSFNKKPNIYSSKPWITTGIAKSIKVKDNLYKKFSSETNLQKKAEYQKQFRTYRNYISIPLRCSKDSYYNGRFEENKRNVKTVWKTVKELITMKQRNKLPLTTLQIDKKIETDAKEIANHFNGYFTSFAGELNRNIVKFKSMRLLYLGSMKDSNMFLTLTKPNDIDVLIDNMKVNKGAGPNSIPTKILKDYKSEFAKPLSDMINTSFTTGIFPSALKVANIIPIHKKGDKLDCNNYRPISLLSNISKIFEKMMHIQLTSFLNKNKVLSSFQFGFRNKHSTNHALISLST